MIINGERALVWICTIDDVVRHPNADFLDVCVVGGWRVIVKKDQFSVGDRAVFFTIDSFLPVEPRYEFLRKNCYRNVKGLGEGFRIKSIRLRKELSQGLVLPLSDFDIYKESDTTWKYTNSSGNQYYIDPKGEQDLSGMFGVIKYDPPVPACLSGLSRGNFPSQIRKTDQERVQNLKKYFEKEILGHVFEASLKLDGTSLTAFKMVDGDIGVCSRNINLKLEGNDDNKYVSFCLKNKLLDVIPEGYAVQGELCGPGIQGNRENLKEDTLFVFDIQDIEQQRYLTPLERVEFFSKYLKDIPNVKHIPILREGLIEIPLDFTIEKFLEISNNQKSLNHPIAEGIVYKRADGEFSFKVISDKFLLNEKD